MPRTQASLPNPSGLGFFVTLLLVCVMIVLNCLITSVLFQVLSISGLRWLNEPRLAQTALFLMPLALLAFELWIGAIIRRLASRTNGGSR